MLITAFIMGLGLSMDAFAVAICKGLKMKKLDHKQLALIALFFGGFQAIMPFIGWLLAHNFRSYIENVDHWIAFALLLFIGVKMIVEAFGDEADDCCDDFNIKDLFIMAIATSIDAMAAGIAFAFDGFNRLLQILIAVFIIGATTFILSAWGVVIGHKFGAVYKSKAELAGGIILVLLGVKILLEHLNVISISFI